MSEKQLSEMLMVTLEMSLVSDGNRSMDSFARAIIFSWNFCTKKLVACLHVSKVKIREKV